MPLYMIVFIQYLYVYLGSLRCIRTYGNAILFCFYDFHHFVLWRGVKRLHLSLHFIWVLAITGWVSGLSVDDSSACGNEMDTFYYLKAPRMSPWRRNRRRGKTSVYEISTEKKNACLLKTFLSSSIKDLRHFLSSMFQSYSYQRLCHNKGNRSTCGYGGGFSCFVIAVVVVPWIPTCGPLPLACEKHAPQVRNRDDTQIITPTDTPREL